MPLLFAIKESQGFSCLCQYDVEAQASLPPPGNAPGLYRGSRDTGYLPVYF